jgi:hypothetical protein
MNKETGQSDADRSANICSFLIVGACWIPEKELISIINSLFSYTYTLIPAGHLRASVPGLL